MSQQIDLNNIHLRINQLDNSIQESEINFIRSTHGYSVDWLRLTSVAEGWRLERTRHKFENMANTLSEIREYTNTLKKQFVILEAKLSQMERVVSITDNKIIQKFNTLSSMQRVS